ncbi:alpha-glucan family phosphorylase [Flavihumibacter stibioxidans]|uniref:starch synthase n=1 Tax=Flavihumibacter stibioxidans TaxID=1834163 RepID=A0ABR7MA31_9BACT|nr:alpha-glucan family phosphorylase [Flavihumibacter stibioxidans]MBC6491466.1 alpha-glucan family phosphorylase [Flavihumibacter stibioxidans]
MPFSFSHPYAINPSFSKRVAYFCMEYAMHQSFKVYAGGLGYLAGSHMKSAHDLQQNMVGIGILWKYGYYDQVRKSDQTMDVLFQEKVYGFLETTDIRFTIHISGHPVWVTAYYLPPSVFNTVPVFFLSTDLPENDYLAQTTCHRLYDANPEAKLAAAVLLGEGGAKLLDLLNWQPDVYHLNESHALPLAFHLYKKYKDLSELKKHLVFTNHTPEEAGNAKSDLHFLEKMGFFSGLPLTEVKAITHTEGDVLDHTASALHLAGKANGVSKLHQQTMIRMWKDHGDICPIQSITNAQHFNFWSDKDMYAALDRDDDAGLRQHKHNRKKLLFEEVSDQNGEIYNEDVLTIVFAKRFTGYKRPELLFHDMDRFVKMVTSKDRPVQIIWAGKPYPLDYPSIGVFDQIAHLCKSYSNCAILVGYEMKLSKLLKGGADLWLNVPRLRHEASGTSGMTAAMNGAVNVGLPDGWFPEFARDKINSFVIPPCDTCLHDHQQDEQDATQLYDLLENEIIPMFYDFPDRWLQIMKQGMRDIVPQFGSDRLAMQYYDELYS